MNVCSVLSQIQSICIDLFNDYYDLKCRDISKVSNICLPNGLPLQYLVLENPKISSFLFKYAKENLAAVNAFIKSP
jgi:hypothetical protein